jgi:hypothetical protein
VSGATAVDDPRPRLPGFDAVRAVAWREPLLVCVVAAVAAILLATLGPPPDDASAHLYRTFLVHHGVFVWDDYWYGGSYPLASYSLLYYPVAALVGNLPLVVAATVAQAGFFRSLSRREWGEAAVWPARVFAVVAAVPLFIGTYPWAPAAAAALGAVCALQRGRLVLFAVAAALALGFNPLAFVFLGLCIAAAFLERRRITARTFVVFLTLGALAAAEAATLAFFPYRGVHPFLRWNLAGVLVVVALCVLLARRGGRLGTIGWVFVLWASACLVAYAVRSPIGDNLVRLRYLALPLALIAARRVAYRPRILASLAVVSSGLLVVVPDAATLVVKHDATESHAAFWSPAVRFLHGHPRAGFRVEVVQTAGRWEAYWLPRAGIPIARGWYRQLDMAQNPLLYRRSLSSAQYVLWLRSLAIDYVLLPPAQLDTAGARSEAQLLRSGRSGLVPVSMPGGWQAFAVPDPTPLITGPGAARVTVFGHSSLTGSVASSGLYTLRIRYMPYWRIRGPVCVSPGPGGMTDLRASARGDFALVAPRPVSLVEHAFDPPRATGC